MNKKQRIEKLENLVEDLRCTVNELVDSNNDLKSKYDELINVVDNLKELLGYEKKELSHFAKAYYSFFGTKYNENTLTEINNLSNDIDLIKKHLNIELVETPATKEYKKKK